MSTSMDVDKHNAFHLSYFRMTTPRTYFSWEKNHIRLLMAAIIKHEAHMKKHGGVKAVWDNVTADLNSHGSFHNNDESYTLLIARNVQARFGEMEKNFRTKFLSPTANLSGTLEWDEESEIMKKICLEKDTEKELKEGLKKDDIEREKIMRNSEIGFNLLTPNPKDNINDNNYISSKSSNSSTLNQRTTPARDTSGDELAAAMLRLDQSIAARSLKSELEAVKHEEERQSDLKERRDREDRDRQERRDRDDREFNHRAEELNMRREELQERKRENDSKNNKNP